MTSPPAGRCHLNRIPNLAPGSKLAGNLTRCYRVPTPRSWHQDHLQRRLRHNLSLRHRHQLPNRWDTGARKGNLVADFAAKPGPAASKVSIPRFQGERRQCGGDLGAAADRGRVHFNSSSYLYFIFKLEYIFVLVIILISFFRWSTWRPGSSWTC